jgi:hypothetical protein
VRVEDEQELPLIMRAARSTYIGFGVIVGFMLVLTLLPLITVGGISLKMLSVVLGAGLFVFGWIRAFKVTVDQTHITYRTLLAGTRTIAIADIQKARVVVGDYYRRSRTEPYMILDLEPRPELHQKAMKINIKVFRLDDVRRLVGVVREAGVLRGERKRREHHRTKHGSDGA